MQGSSLGYVRAVGGSLCVALGGTLALALPLLLAGCEVEQDPGREPRAATRHEPSAPRDAGALVSADTLVVLPDTQFYACAYGDIFERQTQWIADEYVAGRVAAVLHTGDIVDDNVPEQWDVARDAFALLGADVPYLVTTGNHDLDNARRSLGNQYFELGVDAFEARGGEVGCFDTRRVDNVFAVVGFGGERWLLLGLEFGPRDDVLAWADEVLERHAQLPAILFTHAYLAGDGTRYDRSRPGQPHHPDDYAITPKLGIADGEDIYRALVEPHENVRVVLSGHVIPDGLAYAVSTRPSGSEVHEILANYQTCAACPCDEVEGGGGYLRLLELTGDTMHVTTYSPHRDTWLEDPDNTFSFSVR